MMPSPQVSMMSPTAFAVRQLCFSGSIIQGSYEHIQLQTWLDDGLANRPIWALCEQMPYIAGKPSSYVIQAIKSDQPKICRNCNVGFFPSRSSDSEGLYCKWRCYHQRRQRNISDCHRGLGKRFRTHASLRRTRALAAGPLKDYHLISQDGCRVTVAIRGSIDAWLQAENNLRRGGGHAPYAVAEQ